MREPVSGERRKAQIVIGKATGKTDLVATVRVRYEAALLKSPSDLSANRKRSRNVSAVSDAPHMEWQVDFWRRAGRVRYSCLKEAAGEEASMQIQWCLS